MELVESFSKQENSEHFKKGAEILKKEMIENDYKVSVHGADLFLDNCSDALGQETTAFYRLCVVRNINLFI